MTEEASRRDLDATEEECDESPSVGDHGGVDSVGVRRLRHVNGPGRTRRAVSQTREGVGTGRPAYEIRFKRMHSKSLAEGVAMKRAIVVVLILGMALGSLGGCATILKGTSQEVFLVSEPSKADIYIDGQLRGKTPLELKLECDKTYVIEFRKDGYDTQTFNISNSVGGGWIVLDVICGLVPVIVDAATGAWYTLDQDNINAVLESQRS
jgi:hypothetical protein